MTTTVLNFQTQNNIYTCQLTGYSKGDVVQVETAEDSIVSVLVNAEGMDPVVVGAFECIHGRNIIFTLDIPEGLEVTLATATEVIKAVLVQK